MEWIERQLKQRAASRGHHELLQQGAPLVFQQLLAACSSAVVHYNRVAPGVSPLGFSVQQKQKTHKSFTFVSLEHGSDREMASVTVSLELDQAAIFVDHGKRPILPTFLVELRGTAFVLTHEGRPREMEDACEMILNALLFPDLLQNVAMSAKG